MITGAGPTPGTQCLRPSLGRSGRGAPPKNTWHSSSTTPGSQESVLALRGERGDAPIRADPKAATQIEERRRRYGWDATAINAQVFVQAREAFSMLDNLMSSAQPTYGIA